MTKEHGGGSSPDYIEVNIGGIEGVAVSKSADLLKPGENADQIIHLPQGLVGVLDGAGKGHTASAIARSQFESEFTRSPQTIHEAEEGLLRGFVRAVEEVERAEAEEDPDRSMGVPYMTTATIAHIYSAEGGRYMSILHLGDSRLIAMRRGAEPLRTVDESKVHKELMDHEITREQAIMFQHYIDEIENVEDLDRYISVFGADLGIPTDEREEEDWIANGAFQVRSFVLDRQVLSNAIKTSRRPKIDSTPNCTTYPLNDVYAVALMTDGYTDNIRTSEIEKNLELLQLPAIKPAEVLKRLDNLVQNAQPPKRHRDDRSMVLLKL